MKLVKYTFCIYYWNLLFINNLIIIKTGVHLDQE
jgi:hypothetical protein